MTRCIRLHDLHPADAALAGSKSACCAHLLQSGFPVPDGFVVLCDAAGSADLQVLTGHLTAFAEHTRFAVRSSASDEDGASHSFAGVHESLLDVAAHEVPQALEACRASYHSARARAYRESQGLMPRMQAGTDAVLVQVMVDCVAAGVAFTVDPLGGPGLLRINAAHGQGSSVTDGTLPPEEIVVARTTMERVNPPPIGASVVLTPLLLERLVRLLLEVESCFEAPQDIEWCFDGATFWIVQARPVTGLPSSWQAATKPREVSSQPSPSVEPGANQPSPKVEPGAGETLGVPMMGPPLHSQLAPGAACEWTRANLGEILPEQPCPQVLDVVVRALNQGFEQLFGPLFDKRLGPTAAAFYGRPYFNLAQLRQLCRQVWLPEHIILQGLGHAGEATTAPVALPSLGWGRSLATLPHRAYLLGRTLWLATRVNSIFAGLRLRTRALQARNPEQASLPELLETVETTTSELMNLLELAFALGGLTMFHVLLQGLCWLLGYPAERLLGAPLATGEPTVSSQQARDLYELAELARQSPEAQAWLSSKLHETNSSSPSKPRPTSWNSLTDRENTEDGDGAVNGQTRSTSWNSLTDTEKTEDGDGAVNGQTRPTSWDTLKETAKVEHVDGAVKGQTRSTAFWSLYTAYLERYGHRGIYETDWSLPRLAEDPRPLWFALDALVKATTEARGSLEARLETQAVEEWQAFARHLPKALHPVLLPLARALVRLVKHMYLKRELGRFEGIRYLSALRPWHLTLANHLVADGLLATQADYFELTLGEVRNLACHGMDARVAQTLVEARHQARHDGNCLVMPLYATQTPPRPTSPCDPPDASDLTGATASRATDFAATGNAMAPPAGTTTALQGLCTSPGVVRGMVCVVLHPGDFAQFVPDSILVTRATDPSWTPIFTTARGVITEIGGTLSHASTVAREIGLPALANVARATTQLRTGDEVVLDASQGRVYLVAKGLTTTLASPLPVSPGNYQS